MPLFKRRGLSGTPLSRNLNRDGRSGYGVFHVEEEASQAELDTLKAVVDSLYDSLLSSSIEETLRIQLLEEAGRIRSAISIYKIRGAKGVKEAMQSLVGCMLVNQQAIKAFQQVRFLSADHAKAAPWYYCTATRRQAICGRR
jgi:hypothetical protein